MDYKNDYNKLRKLFNDTNPYLKSLVYHRGVLDKEESAKNLNSYVDKYIKLAAYDPNIKAFFNNGEANRTFFKKAMASLGYAVRKGEEPNPEVTSFLKQQVRIIEDRLEEQGLMISLYRARERREEINMDNVPSAPDFITSDGYLVKGFKPSSYIYAPFAKEDWENRHPGSSSWEQLYFSSKNALNNWELGVSKLKSGDEIVVKTWFRDEKAWNVGKPESYEKVFASVSPACPFVMVKSKNGYRLLDLSSPAKNKAIHTYTNKYQAANEFINTTWKFFKELKLPNVDYFYYKAKKEALELIFDNIEHGKFPYTKDDYREWIEAKNKITNGKKSLFHLSVSTYEFYQKHVEEIVAHQWKIPGTPDLSDTHFKIWDKVCSKSEEKDPSINLLLLSAAREKCEEAKAYYNMSTTKALVDAIDKVYSCKVSVPKTKTLSR